MARWKFDGLFATVDPIYDFLDALSSRKVECRVEKPAKIVPLLSLGAVKEEMRCEWETDPLSPLEPPITNVVRVKPFRNLSSEDWSWKGSYRVRAALAPEESEEFPADQSIIGVVRYRGTKIQFGEKTSPVSIAKIAKACQVDALR